MKDRLKERADCIVETWQDLGFGDCERLKAEIAYNFELLNKDLLEQVELMQGALRAFLPHNFGCPYCDSGRLRTPDKPSKDHSDECPWKVASEILKAQGETV